MIAHYKPSEDFFRTRPILAPNRVFAEADPNPETCQFCGSSIKKRFWLFGKILGCINERCENYYETNLKYQ